MGKINRGNSIIKQVINNNEAERQAKAERLAKRKKVVFVRKLIVASFVCIALFTTVSFAHGLVDSGKNKFTNYVNEGTQHSINSFEHVEVTIGIGETAWDIQSELTPDRDIRDMLFLVEELNDKRSLQNVKAGETITFLKDKKQ